MNAFLNGLKKFFSAFVEFLKLLVAILPQLVRFLRGLWRALRRCFRKPHSFEGGPQCAGLSSSLEFHPMAASG